MQRLDIKERQTTPLLFVRKVDKNFWVNTFILSTQDIFRSSSLLKKKTSRPTGSLQKKKKLDWGR